MLCCTLFTSLRKFCVVTRAGLSSIVRADLTFASAMCARTRARTLHRHWRVVPCRFVCALADDGAAVGCRLFCLQDHVITKAGGAAVIADGKAFPEIGQPGTTTAT